MSLSLLANIVWHTLSGPQARHASGADTARRYARGFSPIMGFADPQHPDFAALAPHCEVGEHLYCTAWSGRVPSDWHVDADTAAHQMVWERDPPAADAPLAVARLGREHVPQMLELVALTQPGPFGERTVELGEYWGVLEDGRLVAMAGERMEAGTLKEISGVCTHPAFQGRGYARRLMHRLIRLQLARGQTPFLHVMQGNDAARALYARMGFRHHGDIAVRVVSRSG